MAWKPRVKTRNKIASALNKSLIPLEYSYNIMKKLAIKTKNAAPLVYHEIESLIKNNVIHLKKKKLLKQSDFAHISETITSNLIKKIPTIDEKEIKKIV